MEEKTVLKKEIVNLSENLAQEQVRIEHAEKVTFELNIRTLSTELLKSKILL